MMFGIANISQFMFISIMFVGSEFLLLDMSSFIDFALAYAKIFRKMILMLSFCILLANLESCSC
jgi:hypothetical protein